MSSSSVLDKLVVTEVPGGNMTALGPRVDQEMSTEYRYYSKRE